jgi:hypothetical protein
MFSPGGGSGPKHSAFCGACFSINPYRSLFDTKSSKSDRKNHEPSVFFMAPKVTFLIKIDPHKWHFINYRVNGFRQIVREAIYQEQTNLLSKQFSRYTFFKNIKIIIKWWKDKNDSNIIYYQYRFFKNNMFYKFIGQLLNKNIKKYILPKPIY